MLQVTLENSTSAHQVHLLKKKAWIAQQPKEDDGTTTTATFHQEDARRLSSSSTQNLLHSPSFSSAGVGVAAVAAAEAAVQCTSSSCSGSCISGLPARLMEETSCCGTSFAVDCTLSLGSATSRPDIPARLSRAGSPEPGQDLAWPRASSVRSEQADPSMRRTCDQEKSEQGISWNGSCARGDPNGLPDDYAPAAVPVREVRSGDTKPKLGSNAWSRLCVQSSKDETVGRPKGLLGMLEKRAYDSGRQSWLPDYLTSNGAGGDGNGSSRSDRCMQDGSSLVRVCAHCGTSKTPLWRNGPQGPKSLCNACGIRFKKAGRRLAASANAELQGHAGVVTATKSGKRKLSEEKAQQYWVYPPDAASRKRSRNVFLRPSDSILSGGSCVTWQPFLSPAPQTSHQRDRQDSPRPHGQERTLLQMGAFSNDEEEGAVLLMALSCGLVHA